MSDNYETFKNVEQSDVEQSGDKELWGNAEPPKPSTPWSWRLAGILLLVLLILRVLLILWSGSGPTELIANWRILLDVVLGVGLIAGAAWARTWALWRAVIYIGLAFLAAYQDANYLDVVLQISVGISLFLLLWKEPGQLRTLAGVLVFVMGVFGVMVLALGSTIVGSLNDWNHVEALIEAEEYGEAETLVRQMIVDDPEYDMAHNYLGIIYSAQDLSEQAIEQFNKAIELDPNYPVYYYNRADERIYLGDYDAAIDDIQMVKLLTDDGYEVDMLYTHLYLVQSDFIKANEALQRAEQKGAPEEEIIYLRVYIDLIDQSEDSESELESLNDGA